jgi:opacity protein-like surface antigen
MRNLFFISSFIVCGLLNAATPQQGPYFGLILGPAFAANIDLIINHPLLKQDKVAKFSYGTAFNGGGQIGYRINKFRFEGEGIYNQSSIVQMQMGRLLLDNQQLRRLRISGHTRLKAGFFNAYYELYKKESDIRVVPYIGLGAGYARLDNLLMLMFDQTSLYSKTNVTSTPIGQGILGMSFFLTNTFQANIDYRYLATPQHKVLHSRFAFDTLNFSINKVFI